MHTFTIELQVNFSGEEEEGKLEAMKEACREAGAQLLTVASLISDKRKPQVAVYGQNFFSSPEEIALLGGKDEGDG